MSRSAFRRALRAWDRLAARDPLWAVCTRPSMKGGGWDTEAFFASGRQEWEVILRETGLQGFLPDRESCLDFGCGPGRISRALTSHFREVTGLDASGKMIALAKEMDRSGRVRYLHHEGEQLGQLTSSPFSMVISLIVLQHIPPEQGMGYLTEFMRILKPGGVLVVQVPTADLRKISALRRLRERLMIRERLASTGLVKSRNMLMTVYNRDELVWTLEQHGGTLMEQKTTNHTDPDYAGRFRIITEEESTGYVSSLFIVRKRIAGKG